MAITSKWLYNRCLLLTLSMNKKLPGNIWLHTCNRKGCVWTSKNEDPIHCSVCNSPIWNRVN